MNPGHEKRLRDLDDLDTDSAESIFRLFFGQANIVQMIWEIGKFDHLLWRASCWRKEHSFFMIFRANKICQWRLFVLWNIGSLLQDYETYKSGCTMSRKGAEE